MKVLLIEDDVKTAQLFVQILQTEGYEVVQTGTALDGIWLAKQQSFDAIIFDINLPDLPGTTAGLSLRKVLPHTPFIALTAKADSVTRSLTRAFGFNAFIAKPCTDEDLVNTIRELTEARKKAEI